MSFIATNPTIAKQATSYRELCREIFMHCLCNALEDMLSDWKISKERVHLVMRDNASNMERAMKDADVASFGCFAHRSSTSGT